MLRGETIQLLQAHSSIDPYSGEEFLDWSRTPTSKDVKNVLVEPRSIGEENLDARNQVVSGFTLYLQNGIYPLPSPHDRVVVRGKTYKISGEPAEWMMGDYNPGVVLQAEKVEG